MMTIVDFRKLKSDIIDAMVTDGLLANQSDKNHNDITITPNPANAANATSAEDATNNQTGSARRMALMFHGLNTTSTDDNEDEGDDDSDTNNVMIRNE